MNYTQLSSYIQNYCENQETSFLANISLFVQLAEEDIYRRVKIPPQSKPGNLTTISGQNSVTLPSDFLNFDYLYVVDNTGAANLLLQKDVDFIYQAFPLNSYQNIPLFYANRDNTVLILGPTPDMAYPLLFQYVYAPQSITVSNTSWLGNNAQNALLYGSIVQAYTYMKGDPTLMQQYNALYTDALDQLKKLGEGREKTDEYRNPTPRPIPLNTDQ